MSTLIRPLFDGPLDVVGDVHGEFDALQALCRRLGYDPNGHHPDGRRLVFVGDLCDRGPRSLSVVRRVRQLVQAGRAQCVVGNHELALISGQPKHGNAWFFNRKLEGDREYGAVEILENDEERIRLREFLDTLPIALERPDLRVVHAAWHAESIAACRTMTLPVSVVYANYTVACELSEPGRSMRLAYDALQARRGQDLKNPDARFTSGEARSLGLYDVHYQMSNPLRVLTSGVETLAGTPFFANGKHRFTKREPWWPAYHDPVPVVFGHFWRRWDPGSYSLFNQGEELLFVEPLHDSVMPDHVNAFCIDFSVGIRFKERERSGTPPYHARLAALRWPERDVVFDDIDPVRCTP